MSLERNTLREFRQIKALNKKLYLCLALVLIGILLPCHISYAACTNPAGVKSTIVYNEDEHVMQYCNDTNWIAMGPVPGAGGAGCSNPTGDESDMVYNAEHSVMQYCDGTDWIAMGPVKDAPPSSGLVAHWKFDETSGTTADDATGNTDNDGTLMNGATWAPEDGMIGGAILMDGDDDYIDLPNAASSGAVGNKDAFAAGDYQNMSMSGWTLVTTNGGSYDEITTYIGGTSYVAWADGGTSDRIMRSMVRRPFPDTVNYWPESNGTMTIGEWKHFVYTVEDGVGYKFYLDGVLDKDLSEPDINLNHWNCSAHGCKIGEFGANQANFHGYIDDLRVYNRILTDAEAAALYDYGMKDCTNPTGAEGTMVYNDDHDVMQYCNGDEWIGIQ